MNHVGKEYKGHFVLMDVSVTFESGTVYGLIGENGAGKTVLFRLVCGLSTATEGSRMAEDIQKNQKEETTTDESNRG